MHNFEICVLMIYWQPYTHYHKVHDFDKLKRKENNYHVVDNILKHIF